MSRAAESRPTGVVPLADRIVAGLVALIPTVFLAAMVLWPLLEVFERSLIGVGLNRMLSILTTSWGVLSFTGLQALVSTAATLFVGLPVAHVISRYEFRGRSVLRAIAVVPFVLPTVVVAVAFEALLRRLGLGADAGSGSLWAIIAAHVFFNVAVVIRVVGGHWSRLDRHAVDAARVLGASPVQAFNAVTLRQLAPAIVGASMLVFMFSFTSYGVILILGGGTISTIETEIRRYAIFRSEFDVAAVLALVQVVVVSLLALAGAVVQRRRIAVARRPPSFLPVNSMKRRVHVLLGVLIVAVVVGLPVGALLEQSLSVPTGSISSGAVSSGYSTASYRALLERPQVLPVSAAHALRTSLEFAAAAVVVALLVGITAAKTVTRGGIVGGLIEVLALLPLGVSAVTLGFGYLLSFTVLDFRSSVWIIPLAHSVVGLPFVLGSVLPALRLIDARLGQVAAVLGASPVAVWRFVEWPLLRSAMLSGAGFAAAVSIGEFGATSFLSRSDAGFTAPMAVFRLLSRPGASLRGQSMALSVVLGLLVAIIAGLLDHRRKDEITAI